MKKLLIVVAALAMVVSFLPKAEAGETANLGLTVTFAPSEPTDFPILESWKGYYSGFKQKDQLVIKDSSTWKAIWEMGSGISVPVPAPPEIDFTQYMVLGVLMGEYSTGGHSIEIVDIINEPTQIKVLYKERHPSPGDIVTQALTAPYHLVRTYRSDKAVVFEKINPLPVISIELSQASWILDGVKLGEKRSNIGPDGTAMHAIKNTGNIPVMVDIGYNVDQIYIRIPEAPRPPEPGLEQGFNTFITMVGEIVLPPDGRLEVSHSISPGMEEPLPLTYGAPTGLATGLINPTPRSMSAVYEIRAYPVTE